jgi:hypothetical protein
VFANPTCLIQVFWGLILVVFDASINRIDLLPDFIGYALIAVGSGGLRRLSPEFETARMYAWFLVSVSILAALPLGEFDFLFKIGIVAIDCLMMWALLGGIKEYSLYHDRIDFAELASSRRLAYAAMTVGLAVLGFGMHVFGESVGILAIVIALFLIVVHVLILHLIHRVRMELTM